MRRFSLCCAAALLSLAVIAFVAAAPAAADCGGGGSCNHSTGEHEHGKSTDKHSSGGFLDSYYQMRALLAQDKVTGLDKLAANLGREAARARTALVAGPKDKVRPGQISALKDIERAASTMKTRDIKVARQNFKGLSGSVLAYVKEYGCDGHAYSFYCDMAKGSWLQETDQIGNPYYGSQMLKCGVMTGHMMDGKYTAK